MTLREMLGYAIIAALSITLVVSMVATIYDAIRGDEMARVVLVSMAILTSPLVVVGILAWCFAG